MDKPQLSKGAERVPGDAHRQVDHGAAGDPSSRDTPGQNSDPTRKHLRGSSLLLAGRIIAVFVNFLVQLLTVRYLTKADFGAFGYAISLEAMASSITVFGLDKAVARFIPIYHERGDYARMFGTVLLTLGTLLSVGITLVCVTLVGGHFFGSKLIDDPLAIGLLFILIAMAPLDALDFWFQGMFAVFASPRAIFVRRHLLGPGFRLAVVLAVILSGQGVRGLAVGYVLGGLVGVSTYATMMAQLLRRTGMINHFKWSTLHFPVREVFGFSMPLLTTDLVLILRGAMTVMLLGYFRNTVDVATFKAVLPIAGLNLVVMQSFLYLYTPLAARLFARQDPDAINDLYWRTAIWIAVISFPVFVVSFSLATPVTVFLFGDRYADSGAVLAILSFGYYFNAALGFNSHTLRVYGKVAYIVTIDVTSAVLNLVLSVTLIPSYGAVGAAVAASGSIVIYNIFNHAGLLLGTGIDLLNWRYLRVYAAISVAALGILALQEALHPPLFVGMIIAAIATLVLFRMNRRILAVGDLFPELQRVPILRPLLGL